MNIFEVSRTARRRISVEHVGKVLAYLVPIVGAAGVVIPYLLGFTTLAILATYIAIPCLLAPALYWYSSEGYEIRNYSSIETEKLLVSGYLVLQSISIYLLATRPVRPYSYYAIVAMMASLVLLNILYFAPTRGRSLRILLQIVLLQLNVIWGVTFKYNLYIGRTDFLSHAWLVRRILANQTTVGQFEGFYQSFPLWHILGTIQHLVLGSPGEPRMTLFAISGLMFCATSVAVYLTASRLFDSYKVALTAALLTSIYPTVIENGMYAIPRSAAGFFFALLLLSWVKSDDRSIILFALFTITVAAYHTISLPFIFLILSVEYFFRRLILPGTVDTGMSYRILLFVGIAQTFYWIFFADYLVRHVLRVAVQPSVPGEVNSGVIANPVAELANYLHQSAILILLLVGILIGLRSARLQKTAKATILSALVLAAVSFPGPQLLIGKLAETFNVLRFAQYTFPFITMTSAYGLVSLYRRTETIGLTGSQIRTIALVIFVLLSFLTVSNDFTASDNPLVERQFYTFYISESEEESMRTMAELGSENVPSDYVTARYLEASEYQAKSGVVGMSADRDEMYLRDGDLLLVRAGELEQRPLQLWETDDPEQGEYDLGSLEYVSSSAPLWGQLGTMNRVFDSGSVVGYEPSPVASSNQTVTASENETADRNATTEGTVTEGYSTEEPRTRSEHPFSSPYA